MPISDWKRGLASCSGRSPTVSSSSRRSMAEARRGISAIAAAVMIRVPKTNASNGRSIVTLHLDFDDLLDPQVPDGLHDERAEEHHLPHALPEQQVHVLGVDERQRDTEHRRQSEQHVAGEPAVRRVNPNLAEDLEALAHDVREVLEDLREVA